MPSSSLTSPQLIETGRVFADPSKRTPQSVAHTNARLKSFVAQAQEHFHESVDELEGELVREVVNHLGSCMKG